MRRPLLAVNMLLVAVVWIIMALGGWDSPPGLERQTGRPENGTVLYATGQVCQKENNKIWLRSVTICLSGTTFHNSGNSEQNIPFQEKLICELEAGAEEIPLGSRVLLQGTFSAFSSATNPGEFDAAVYYRSLGAGGRLRKAKLMAMGENYWHVREAAYDLRQYLCERLNRVMAPKYAGVMRTLLLGDKTDLDGEMKALFQRNGILHILSISSLHITIIGMGAYKILRKIRVPIIPAALAGSLLLLFYGMLTGFSLSACRAIGMYLLRMAAELLGRSYDTLTALGIMAAVMVLVNPYYLQNTGFLLSFSSVMGIGAFYTLLAGRKRGKAEAKFFGEKRWHIVLRRLWQKVRESGTVSLSVTLATMPIQLWSFYEIPTYSLFANLLIVPFVKPLMAAGFLSLLPAGGIAARAGEGILGCYETICAFFDSLPFHTWRTGRPEVWQVAVYYGLLAVAVLLDERRWEKEKRKKALKGAVHYQGLKYAVLIAAVVFLTARFGNPDRVTFPDVGQGDCCLVQTASGENYLFDCGSSNRSGIGKYVLLPCLKYYGISKLDAVFVSHPDADHINGIVELLELAQMNHLEIKQLVLPAIEAAARWEQFDELFAAAGDVRVSFVGAGEEWGCDRARFICLHPEKGYSAADSNVYSMCVYGEFETFSLLLTGDVEGEGENALTDELEERGISDVTILKVAHHGSKYSTDREFLEQVSPRAAVISSGRNNRYGHPHEETLRRLEEAGAEVFQTAKSGAIIIYADRNGLRVKEELKR